MRWYFQNAYARAAQTLPVSWRRRIIGSPEAPSRVATWAHRLLNRLPMNELPVLPCCHPLEGCSMKIDWRKHRSYLAGTWEEAVVEKLLAQVRAGDTVLDIGAHIGFYTLLLAKRVGPRGRVISFEPIPENFRILAENVRLNQFEHVIPVSKAVLARAGRFTLKITREEPVPSSVPLDQDTGSLPVEVEAVPLDDFLRGIGPVHLIKMDVEGAEEQVIRSGLQTILQFHPTLLVELHHATGKAKEHPVPRLLESLDYQMEWLDESKWNSHIWATYAARRE